MTTLVKLAAQSGYGVSIPSPRSAILSGPVSAFAKDVERNAITVNATWIFDQYGFQYIRSFYRNIAKQGVLPFDASLIIDSADPATYTVRILPGTFALSKISNGQFYIAATLEVKALPFDPNAAPIFLIQLSSDDPDTYLDLLAEIVNTDWPQ